MCACVFRSRCSGLSFTPFASQSASLLLMIFECPGTHLIAIRASCTSYNYSPMCAWPVQNWIRQLKDLRSESLKCVDLAWVVGCSRIGILSCEGLGGS